MNYTLSLYIYTFILNYMGTKVDYTRKKFGLLTVMEAIEPSNGHNKGGLWLCKCRCGKTITLCGYSLSHRDSCGCMVKKATRARAIGNRSPETLTYTAEYHKYRQEYRDGMSKNEWIEICVQPCIYCGTIDIRNRAGEESYKSVIPLTDDEVSLYQVPVNSIVIVDTPRACCSVCRKMRGKLSHWQFCQQVSVIVTKLQQPG